MGAESQILAWVGLWGGPVELRVTLCCAQLCPLSQKLISLTGNLDLHIAVFNEIIPKVSFFWPPQA